MDKEQCAVVVSLFVDEDCVEVLLVEDEGCGEVKREVKRQIVDERRRWVANRNGLRQREATRASGYI